MKKKTYKFQVFKSILNKQWYFHLRASNGQIELTSEGYKSKRGAVHAIASIQSHATVIQYLS